MSGVPAELLARISNWLHGKTGESVLELTREVDAALVEPTPHRHEHTVLTRDCEFCMNAARALTMEERHECMALLQSLEPPGRRWWRRPLLKRAITTVRVNATALDAAIDLRHCRDHLGAFADCRENLCVEHHEVRSETLALLNELEAAENAESIRLESLLRDQLADARAECERWQKDNVTLARINAEHAETIRVLRAELQGAQAACAAWQVDYQRLRDESNKAAVAFQTAWKEESSAQQDLGEKIEGLHTTLATERREVRSLKEQLAEAYKLSDQNDHLIGQLKERIENAAEEKTSLEAVIAGLRKELAEAPTAALLSGVKEASAAWERLYNEERQKKETFLMQITERDRELQTLRSQKEKGLDTLIADDKTISKLRAELDAASNRYKVALHDLTEERRANATAREGVAGLSQVLRYIHGSLQSAMDAQVTELTEVIKSARRAADLTQMLRDEQISKDDFKREYESDE